MSDRITTTSNRRLNPEVATAARVPEASSARHMQASETGVHPAAAKVAIGATIWFLLVTGWPSLGAGKPTSYSWS
jgi:hypothetical protein